jgi:hypothetical protein
MSEANGEQASKRPRREASKQVAVATAALAAGSDDEGANDNAAAAALPKPNLPGAAGVAKEEEEEEEDTAPTAEMLNELFAADEEGDYFDDDHEPVSALFRSLLFSSLLVTTSPLFTFTPLWPYSYCCALRTDTETVQNEKT